MKTSAAAARPIRLILLGLAAIPAADAFSTKVGTVPVDAVLSEAAGPFKWPVIGKQPL